MSEKWCHELKKCSREYIGRAYTKKFSHWMESVNLFYMFTLFLFVTKKRVLLSSSNFLCLNFVFKRTQKLFKTVQKLSSDENKYHRKKTAKNVYAILHPHIFLIKMPFCYSKWMVEYKSSSPLYICSTIVTVDGYNISHSLEIFFTLYHYIIIAIAISIYVQNVIYFFYIWYKSKMNANNCFYFTLL